jgi:hypothetical protein
MLSMIACVESLSSPARWSGYRNLVMLMMTIGGRNKNVSVELKR